MGEILLEHVDETFIRVHADLSLSAELKDNFSFYAPAYKFHPKYKAGFWDGRISLINWKDRTIYKGLLPDIEQFCHNRDIKLSIDDKIFAKISPYTINDQQVYEFYNKIRGPFKPLDTQVAAFKHCINNGRAVILAPTSNGKSYIIHGLCAFFTLQKKRVLIIIDRSQLVEQLRDNIDREYGGKNFFKTYTVYDKNDPLEADVYITTRQSCYNLQAKWFKQFDVLIGDEVHKFKAESLKAIVSKCGHIPYRFGFTATLDNDSKTDRSVIIGMFGTPLRVATTQDLVEAGIVAKPKVYAIVLKYYPDDIREIYKRFGKKVDNRWVLEYPDEIQFLETCRQRNKFVADLANHVEGNTLVSFRREAHGTAIHKALLDSKRENVHYVDGTIKLKDRLEISEHIDESTDSVAVVSIGTFSTGINIKNINNIINACSLKSKITVPQLIGRGLRLSETKNTVDIYDIGDDLKIGKRSNTTYRHFTERLQMYAADGFEIKIVEKNIRISFED